MKVVISGASGFVGRVLVRRLLAEGVECVALGRDVQALERALGPCPGKDALRMVDAADTNSVIQGLAAARALVHCAFSVGRGPGGLASSMKFGRDLMRIAREAGCESVVNISTQSVYDAHRDYAATECSPIVLATPYATAKYASELALDDLLGGTPHVSVRLASLMGPGADKRVLNKMAARALAGDRLEVQGGSQVFDYMDVEDAASALSVLVSSDPDLWPAVLNVGSSQPMTLLSIAHAVLDAVSSRGMPVEEPLVTALPAGGDTNSALCCDRFLALTGWQRAFTFEESVRRIVESLA